jgi:hypothetical protein
MPPRHRLPLAIAYQTREGEAPSTAGLQPFLKMMVQPPTTSV